MSDRGRLPGLIGLLSVAAFTVAAFFPYAGPGRTGSPRLVELDRLDVFDLTYLSTFALLATGAAASLAIRRGKGGSLAAGSLAGAGALLFLRLARIAFPLWQTAPASSAGIALAAASGAMLGAGVAAAAGGRSRTGTRSRIAIAAGGVLIAISRFVPFAYQPDPDRARALASIDLPLGEIQRAAAIPGPPWASQVLWGLLTVALILIVCLVAASRQTGFALGWARAAGIAELALAVASIAVILATSYTIGIAAVLSLMGGSMVLMGSRRPRPDA